MKCLIQHWFCNFFRGIASAMFLMTLLHRKNSSKYKDVCVTKETYPTNINTKKQSKHLHVTVYIRPSTMSKTSTKQ